MGADGDPGLLLPETNEPHENPDWFQPRKYY
jgi:hypothetical protein